VVFLIVLNVLDPVIVSVPAPPWFSIGYVSPPPTNVLALADDISIVAVPGVRVIPVVVPRFHAVAPDPSIFQVPLPRFNALVFELALLKRPIVTLYPFVLNVPVVIVKVFVTVAIVKLPTSCQVPPAPLNVNGKSVVIPLVVISLVPEVAANVLALLPVAHVIVDDRVRSP
jgi:hypothetical protein